MQLSLALTPVLPLLAAALLVFVPARQRLLAVFIALGAIVLSCICSVGLFLQVAVNHVPRVLMNFDWLQVGDTSLRLGLLLDPLGAVMLVMVTVIALLIFLFSAGYMAEDARFSRFFCFMSLFVSAMLGVIVANDLLLLFMCWEVMGVASYLLIGFWFSKPAAAAAARKAFITTRIGDVALFVGLLWLNSAAGTLVFFEGGNGVLEGAAISKLANAATTIGLPVSAAIGLLLFAGAMAKSGQFPLHVWLPDAMEGPTPVSALIHAATMVAAGVFLMARVHPLLAAMPDGATGLPAAAVAITWVGAITAMFGSLAAVPQTDIKRILAYSTISQLGYMMMGLGAGGVAVAMFHLITHAFFKALLFLGAGSVIHGCHGEQDVRRMGGLQKRMPVTFGAYSVGMLALAGIFPLAGFWSKDEILHSAFSWPITKGPFLIGLVGAGITAFYMTRQMALVFFGPPRGSGEPHESPGIMSLPLLLLAGCVVVLGLVGKPFWAWFQNFLTGEAHPFHWGPFLGIAAASTAMACLGIWLAWRLYTLSSPKTENIRARLEQNRLLREAFYLDQFYAATVIPFYKDIAACVSRADRALEEAIGKTTAAGALGVAWVARLADELLVNGGFDSFTRSLKAAARTAGQTQGRPIQTYLRVLAIGLTALVLVFAWGCGKQ